MIAPAPTGAGDAALEPRGADAADPVPDGEGRFTAPAAPFEIVRPEGLKTPFVCASPHSGRLYPPEMMAASPLSASAIRRSEDAYVDDLIAGAPGHGAALIRACYARAYIDVNREAFELDPSMFEDELPPYARAASARVAAGLGSIPKVVAEGQEIYRSKLRFAEARARIEGVHRPYHAALAGLLDEARTAFGVCVLLDWHSMPSAAAAAGRAAGPDMVLGDRFGAACSPAITALVENTLRRLGYKVGRNVPYAGGHSTELYGRPGDRMHALQIEINRGLYLDEKTVRPGGGLARLTAGLSHLFAALAASDWRAFR